MMTSRAYLSIALFAALGALLPAPAGAAGPERYALDPVHTRVLFAISHAGFSSALGTVSGSTGTLDFDRDDWRSARLDVSVPISRLDLGDAKWSAAALASNLLDGNRYPRAHFVSSSIEPADRDHAKVCGELSLHGVTKPLCLDVTFNQLKRHPLPPFRRTAGFSATATLSRADFGISAWKSVIGDAVQLRIEAEAVRDNRGGAADGTSPEPSPASNDTPDIPDTHDEPDHAEPTTCSPAPCDPTPDPTP